MIAGVCHYFAAKLIFFGKDEKLLSKKMRHFVMARCLQGRKSKK